MDDRPDEVVREELEALEDVSRKLAALPPAKTASEAPILKELFPKIGRTPLVLFGSRSTIIGAGLQRGRGRSPMY